MLEEGYIQCGIFYNHAGSRCRDIISPLFFALAIEVRIGRDLQYRYTYCKTKLIHKVMSDSSVAEDVQVLQYPVSGRSPPSPVTDIEYGAVVWDPFLKKDRLLLEYTQKFALQMCLNKILSMVNIVTKHRSTKHPHFGTP